VGPRVGVAWRVTPNTVVRGGYGITFDPLTGINQTGKVFLGHGRSGRGLVAESWNQLGQPRTSIEQTFGRQVLLSRSTRGLRPTGSSTRPDRMPGHSSGTSRFSDRFTIFGTLNRLFGELFGPGWMRPFVEYGRTPGPGVPPRLMRGGQPLVGWYELLGTSTGNANYNALEAKLERRFAHVLRSGLLYLVEND